MRLSKTVWIVIGIVVLLIGVKLVLVLTSHESDQVLIERALEESIKASKEGRPGGVMDKLSAHLKVNDMETSGNRSQIAQFIKDSKPDVIVQNKRAVVSGDEAEMVSPVDIELGFLGQKRSIHLDEVTMVFKKENDYDYLVIPTHKWKLAEVRVPDSALGEFIQ